MSEYSQQIKRVLLKQNIKYSQNIFTSKNVHQPNNKTIEI